MFLKCLTYNENIFNNELHLKRLNQGFLVQITVNYINYVNYYELSQFTDQFNINLGCCSSS